MSHILPPSPSGQATVLYRLLRGLPADRYVLISRSDYENGGGDDPCTLRLPARYFRLKSALRPPPPEGGAAALLRAAPGVLLGIRGRASQIERIVRQEACELLIGCSGDLYDLPATSLAARRVGIPFIPYMFDDYIHQWTGSWRRIARGLEPLCLRRVRTIVVPNEHMGREYERRYGKGCTLIRNPSPLPDLAELDRAERILPEGGVHIVYTGAVYHAQLDAFRNLLAALGRLGRPDVRLHVFTAQSEPDLRGRGVAGPAVVFHPHIPQAEVPRVLRQADVLFLPLAFESSIPEVIRTSAPGKMGEYLAAGRPILVHAPADSFVSWYFRENGCGLVVDRNDPILLAEAVGRHLDRGCVEAAREMAARARASAERDFGLEAAEATFSGLLRRIREAP